MLNSRWLQPLHGCSGEAFYVDGSSRIQWITFLAPSTHPGSLVRIFVVGEDGLLNSSIYSQVISNSYGMSRTVGLFTRALPKSVRFTVSGDVSPPTDVNTIADGSVIKLAGPFGVSCMTKGQLQLTHHGYRKGHYMSTTQRLCTIFWSRFATASIVNNFVRLLILIHILTHRSCIPSMRAQASPCAPMPPMQSLYSADLAGSGADMTLGTGLFATSGDMHRRQRKMLNPVFSIAHMREMGKRRIPFSPICRILTKTSVPIFYDAAEKVWQSICLTLVTGAHISIPLAASYLLEED